MAGWMLMSICLGISLTLLLTLTDALECYQCANMRSSSEDSTLSNLIAGNVDPYCDSPTIGTVSTVRCPNSYGYKCGYVEGTITGQILWSHVSITVTSRDCIATYEANGCQEPDEDAKSLFNNVFKLMTGYELDGKVCYCDEDYCDATCRFLIGDVCLPDWAVYLVGAVGGILILSGCFCCCCCCCKPCQRNPAPIHVPQAQTVTYVTTPGPAVGAGAIGSCTNPMYAPQQGNNQLV